MFKHIVKLLPIVLLGCIALQSVQAQPDIRIKSAAPEQPAQDKVPEIATLESFDGDLMTIDLLYRLTRVYSPAVSPDGKWVLFSMNTPDIEANKGSAHLYLVPVKGGDVRQLTAGNSSEWNGIWSPDGKTIAFLSSRDGAPQIYTIAIDGGEALRISDVKNGVSNLQYSPNGKYFSFTSDVKEASTVAEKYPQYPKANVRVYDDLPVRHWDTWEDDKYSHLFIVPVSGGTPTDLMAGEQFETPDPSFGGGSAIAWAPDGKQIAYDCKKVENYESSTNTDVFLYDIASKSTKNITQGMPGFDREPLFSPDGKWIAFNSMERAGHEADKNRLMLYNRETGKIEELSKTLDQWVHSKLWAPNSKSIYLTAEDGATVQIYNIEVPSGTWSVVSNGMYNYDGGLDITPDGKTLVFGRRNFNRPTELFTMPAKGGEVKALTDANGEIFKRIRPATIEERWITAKDGKKIQSWVVFPPDFDPNKKYPLITYCQGGPQATVSQFFSYAWNFLLYASKGYVVVAPNRRGLPGFGQEWNDAISQDWGGMPMQDILSATDEMFKEKYIDRNRAAAIGASAGGYAAFWLAGNHEGRFSAFVSHCGVFNLESMYGATEELWFTNWENGGPYWESEFKQNYDKHSPHRFAQNWDAPMLIITGEKDYRVPYTQSLEAFTVAQVKGLPSKLIYYPEENHWVLHPQEQLIWFHEFFEFLDTHCKNKESNP